MFMSYYIQLFCENSNSLQITNKVNLMEELNELTFFSYRVVVKL